MKDIDSCAKIIWNYMLMHQPLEKTDAIVVLGSSDVRIAEHGAKLYLDGWAPLLVFSGKAGRTTDGLWGMTEAEKFASVAMEMGVPKENILLEKESTNTGENIQFTRRLIEESNIAPNKLLLIQKPYMERRTYATFKKQWPGMEFIVSSPNISYEEYPQADRSKEHVLNMLVGDLQRIREYPAKGFQIAQDIPQDVWEAGQYLIQAGYSAQLIK